MSTDDNEFERAQTAKSKQDWRLDPQRVAISAFLAGAAVLGTLLGYFLRGNTLEH